MCFCCPSVKCCTVTAAIITGLQGSLLAILNICIVSACTCSIDPPGNLGAQFMKKLWSWFIYDFSNCEKKYDSYDPPYWVEPVPDDLSEANSWNIVNQHANFIYQIIYIPLHIIWFITAGLLLYAAGRHHYKFYFPWIVTTIVVIFFDTLCGSFYIRIMSEVNPGWDDGQAIFAMQFLYFRGFVFYIYNIMALCYVLISCCKTYDKERRRNNLIEEIGKKNVTVQQQIIVNTSQPTDQENPGPSYVNTSPIIEDANTKSITQRPLAPTKLRPFSYTNPEYRPTDPADVDGMKQNTKPIFPPADNEEHPTKSDKYHYQ